jgi:hypothetical protein
MHIFIMSKIIHSHRQYDMRRRHGRKPGPNRAKGWPAEPGPNRAKGWLADHTSLADRPEFGIFLKSVFNTCQPKLARTVSNMGMVVLPQNLAARPS